MTVVGKTETLRTRHFTLEVEVGDGEGNYTLSATIVETYDVRGDSYTFEIESVGWISGMKETDSHRIEEMVTGYLIGNAPDILA